MFMMKSHFSPGGIEYDGRLGWVGWSILSVMLGLIVVGLGWCFYRAIAAAKAGKYEEQVAEI